MDRLHDRLPHGGGSSRWRIARDGAGAEARRPESMAEADEAVAVVVDVDVDVPSSLHGAVAENKREERQRSRPPLEPRLVSPRLASLRAGWRPGSARLALVERCPVHQNQPVSIHTIHSSPQKTSPGLHHSNRSGPACLAPSAVEKRTYGIPHHVGDAENRSPLAARYVSVHIPRCTTPNFETVKADT